jgi:hypothetical protein
MEEEIWESEITHTKERITALEEKIREGEKSPGQKDREAHARIDEIEKYIVKDRAERKEFECNIDGEKGILLLLFKLFICFYKVKKYIIITVLYVTDYIVISGSLARTLEASSSPSARESSDGNPGHKGIGEGYGEETGGCYGAGEDPEPGFLERTCRWEDTG